jgi:hypothetical protein
VDLVETTALLAYVKQATPHQRMDEFTADAWADLLEDVTYADARLAVKAILKRQQYVAPSEVLTEIKRARAAALDSVDVASLIPAADPDRPRDYARTIRQGLYRAPDPGTKDVRSIIAEVQRALPAMPQGERPSRKRKALRPATSQPGQ